MTAATPLSRPASPRHHSPPGRASSPPTASTGTAPGRTPSARSPSPGPRSTQTHLELIDLATESGPQVRAWHSSVRWAQVAARHLGDASTPADDHVAAATNRANALQALLRETGVLTAPDAGEPPRIVVVGTGPLAARVAPRLLPLGRELLLSTSPGPAGRPPARPSHTTVPWQADLVSSTPRRGAALLRGDPLDRVDAHTLVVVCSDTVETDRGLVARLVRRGVPHVLLGAHHDRAWVGPFWTPATASCLACHDHWVAGVDADYPTVLAELCRRPAHPDDLMAEWAATMLVAHLSRPDMGRSSLAGRMEVFDRAEPSLHESTIIPHPECPCRRHDVDEPPRGQGSGIAA